MSAVEVPKAIKTSIFVDLFFKDLYAPIKKNDPQIAKFATAKKKRTKFL